MCFSYLQDFWSGCTGLFFFLKEARGMPRADNIKEIEEEMRKEQKIENTNNKES